jgi:hypothetical protein
MIAPRERDDYPFLSGSWHGGPGLGEQHPGAVDRRERRGDVGRTGTRAVAEGVAGTFDPVATVPAAAGVYSLVRYTNSGVAAGTYRYRVRSCNLGCSAWITSGDLVLP